MQTPRYLCIRLLAVPLDVQDAELEEDTEEETENMFISYVKIKILFD